MPWARPRKPSAGWTNWAPAAREIDKVSRNHHRHLIPDQPFGPQCDHRGGQGRRSGARFRGRRHEIKELALQTARATEEIRGQNPGYPEATA